MSAFRLCVVRLLFLVAPCCSGRRSGRGARGVRTRTVGIDEPLRVLCLFCRPAASLIDSGGPLLLISRIARGAERGVLPALLSPYFVFSSPAAPRLSLASAGTRSGVYFEPDASPPASSALGAARRWLEPPWPAARPSSVRRKDPACVTGRLHRYRCAAAPPQRGPRAAPQAVATRSSLPDGRPTWARRRACVRAAPVAKRGPAAGARTRDRTAPCAINPSLFVDAAPRCATPVHRHCTCARRRRRRRWRRRWRRAGRAGSRGGQPGLAGSGRGESRAAPCGCDD